MCRKDARLPATRPSPPRTAHAESGTRAAARVAVHSRAVRSAAVVDVPAPARAVVAEAQQYEKLVFALAAGPEDAARASDAGVALLLHTPWESALDQDQLQRIGVEGTPVVTTLQAWKHLLAALEGERRPEPLAADVLRAGHPA